MNDESEKELTVQDYINSFTYTYTGLTAIEKTNLIKKRQQLDFVNSLRYQFDRYGMSGTPKIRKVVVNSYLQVCRILEDSDASFSLPPNSIIVESDDALIGHYYDPIRELFFATKENICVDSYDDLIKLRQEEYTYCICSTDKEDTSWCSTCSIEKDYSLCRSHCQQNNKIYKESSPDDYRVLTIEQVK